MEVKNINHKDRSVKIHYESWPFPGSDFLSKEGLIFLRHIKKCINKESLRYSSKIRVIDMGCGTGNTTLSLAKIFPRVLFFGIDISKKSIQAAIQAAETKNLKNVTFIHQSYNEDISSLGRFNIVINLGSLHHVKDIDSAFQNISKLINENGSFIVWLYGQYGRLKHNLNQQFIQILVKNMMQKELFRVAESFLEEMGPQFAIETGFYTPKGQGEEGLDWMLNHPQWLADQMIPAYEHGFTMSEILHYFKKNNLSFWKWFGVSTHLKTYTSSNFLIGYFQRLSPHDQLIAIDYLIKPSYYFVSGKKVKT